MNREEIMGPVHRTIVVLLLASQTAVWAPANLSATPSHRVYQLLEDCSKVVDVRWPDGTTSSHGGLKSGSYSRISQTP